jgi:hypothetical protein
VVLRSDQKRTSFYPGSLGVEMVKMGEAPYSFFDFAFLAQNSKIVDNRTSKGLSCTFYLLISKDLSSNEKTKLTIQTKNIIPLIHATVVLETGAGSGRLIS